MKTTTLPPSGSTPGAPPPPLKDQLGRLESALQLHLGAWHRARRQAVAQEAVLALIVAASVNLTKVARACASSAPVASHYRRLQETRKNRRLKRAGNLWSNPALPDDLGPRFTEQRKVKSRSILAKTFDGDTWTTPSVASGFFWSRACRVVLRVPRACHE